MNAMMEQHSNFKILSSEKLIIEYYYGEVTKDVIIDMRINIINDKDYNSSFNSIMDFRDSVMNINHDDIMEIIDFIQNNIVLDSNRKIALLTHTPMHVVMTTLFTNYGTALPMHYKIFSTLKATTSWITGDNMFRPVNKNDDKFKLIAKTIDGLRI